MFSSAEDAFSLLNKWKDEQSLIFALFVGSGFSFACKGIILQIEGAHIEIAHTGAKLLLDLTGAKFLYEDPREAPEKIRDTMESKYVCEITAILPTGDRCAFFERKTE